MIKDNKKTNKYHADWNRKRYAERRELELCINCGLWSGKFWRCLECRIKHSTYARMYHAKNREKIKLQRSSRKLRESI